MLNRFLDLYDRIQYQQVKRHTLSFPDLSEATNLIVTRYTELPRVTTTRFAISNPVARDAAIAFLQSRADGWVVAWDTVPLPYFTLQFANSEGMTRTFAVCNGWLVTQVKGRDILQPLNERDFNKLRHLLGVTGPLAGNGAATAGR